MSENDGVKVDSDGKVYINIPKVTIRYRIGIDNNTEWIVTTATNLPFELGAGGMQVQFVDPLINGEKQFPQPIFEIKVVDSKPVITVVEPKAAQNVPQLQNQQSDVNTQSDIQNALTEFLQE